MSQSLQEVVAAEIRVGLARRQISGTELARRMGRSQVYLSRRLTGRVPIDVADLERIAEVLDVPVTSLLLASAA